MAFSRLKGHDGIYVCNNNWEFILDGHFAIFFGDYPLDRCVHIALEHGQSIVAFSEQYSEFVLPMEFLT